MYKIDWLNTTLEDIVRLGTAPVDSIIEAKIIAKEWICRRFSWSDVRLIHRDSSAFGVMFGNRLVGYVRIMKV